MKPTRRAVLGGLAAAAIAPKNETPANHFNGPRHSDTVQGTWGSAGSPYFSGSLASPST